MYCLESSTTLPFFQFLQPLTQPKIAVGLLICREGSFEALIHSGVGTASLCPDQAVTEEEIAGIDVYGSNKDSSHSCLHVIFQRSLQGGSQPEKQCNTTAPFA